MEYGTFQTLAVFTFYCILFSIEVIIPIKQTHTLRMKKNLRFGKVGELFKVLEPVRRQAGNPSPVWVMPKPGFFFHYTTGCKHGKGYMSTTVLT